MDAHTWSGILPVLTKIINHFFRDNYRLSILEFQKYNQKGKSTGNKKNTTKYEYFALHTYFFS